jgi:hypothetical protein
MSEQAAAPAAESQVASAEAPSAESSETEGSQVDAATSTAAIEADPTLTKAEKVAAKKTLKQLKLKVDGKEYTEDLPFEIPEEASEYMAKQLQLAKAAQKRMNEKATLQKDVDAFLDVLRKDPRKVLSDPNINVDLKQLARTIIEEDIENAKKSPEQLELERAQRELQVLKEEREREVQEFRKQEFERAQKQAYEQYEVQVDRALEKSHLPKSPYVVKKMAEYMYIGLNKGVDLSPEEVLPLVEQEISEDIKSMFAVMPEDVIEAIIGKDVLSKMRKKRVAQAKAAPPATASQVKDTGKADKPAAKAKDEKKMSIKDFLGI